MLKHKLSRADPQTMAQVMAIVDKYTTTDAAMKKSIVVDDQGQIVTDEQAKRRQPGDHHPRRHGHDNRHGKRKDDQPDSRYGAKQVAAVHEDPAAGGSRRQRPDDRPPRANYTLESMLDGPCKFHSDGSKPANHTTCQCSWTKKMAEAGGLPLPPPSPAGGPPDNRERRNRREDTRMVTHDRWATTTFSLRSQRQSTPKGGARWR
jgi:hypothetical protein